MSISYDHEGKIKQITKYFETRKEVQHWLARVAHEKNTGQFVEPNKVTVGEWVTPSVEKLRVAQRTDYGPLRFSCLSLGPA